MRSLLLLAFAGTSFAVGSSFQGASPFFFFSTSEILASSAQISSAKSLTESLEHHLSKCPTDIYVLAHQPGVCVDDYASSSSAVFAQMQCYFSDDDKRIRSSFSVSEVVGHIDPVHLRELLQTKCGAGSMHLDARLGLFDLADDSRPRVISLSMNEIPKGQGRRAAAHVNEMYLKTMMDMLPTNNFTVLYTTTPLGNSLEAHNDMDMEHDIEDFEYEMDHTDGFVHMELRREINNERYGRTERNDTKVNEDAPLFEKYSYLTPALFMGLSVTVLLLSILYVGVNALAGLEVSYAAFDKENGPQTQKKQ